jgi:hypothetical protein
VTATASVPATPEALFSELSDLDAHGRLAAPHVEIQDLHGPRGARTGGIVRLNGPLGLRVVAQTRVRTARPGRELSGTVRTDSGTTGTLTWRLEPRGAHTIVTARLTAEPGSLRDLCLLSAGGRRWLRCRLRTAIGRLCAADPPALSRLVHPAKNPASRTAV